MLEVASWSLPRLRLLEQAPVAPHLSVEEQASPGQGRRWPQAHLHSIPPAPAKTMAPSAVSKGGDLEGPRRWWRSPGPLRALPRSGSSQPFLVLMYMSRGGGELGDPTQMLEIFQTGALEKKLGEGRSGETAGGGGSKVGCSAPAPGECERDAQEGIMSWTREAAPADRRPPRPGSIQDSLGETAAP